MTIKRQLDKFLDLKLDFNYLSLISSPNEKNLTFIDEEKYLHNLENSYCFKYVLIDDKFLKKIQNKFLQNFVTVKEPRLVYFQVLNKINNEFNSKKSQSKNVIHSSARILSSIPENADIRIGANTLIEKNTIIHPGTYIGENCKIGPFCVIGEQGYEVKRFNGGSIRIEHSGNTTIGDFVDINSFTSVHKAVYKDESTSIGSYTKIDSHVHIGHGNKIGCNNLICSHANISGNTIIKDRTYIGPGANIPNRLLIEDGSRVLVGSTVTKNIAENSTVSGNFAIDHSKHLKSVKDSSKQG